MKGSMEQRFSAHTGFDKPVLALDSALAGCVGAVLKGGAAVSSFAEPMAREQASRLIPLVETAMAQAGVAYKDLGLIVTTIGPGSFTGLRISLSAARALGLALGIPVQGVTTLEAMARSAVPEEAACLVVLETKRSDFYVQGFGPDKVPLEDPHCLEPDDLRAKIAGGTYILCGDGLERLGLGGRAQALYNPEIMARAGLARFLGNSEKAKRPEPLYLRGADISVSNKVQRQIENFPVS